MNPNLRSRFILYTVILVGLGSLCVRAYAQTVPPADVPGAINPAVTQDNISSTVCVPGWTATVRPPVSYTNKLKIKQMAEYGLPGKPSDYEEDHRVDLGAGGHPTDPRNLWPQPRSGVWGAARKDRLEVFVQRSICAHKMTLADGQAIMLGNWEDAYVRYFGQPPASAATP